MSDPYFQKLFADRIGGANYGKGTEIYKFEKIKRAKRKARADHPDRATCRRWTNPTMSIGTCGWGLHNGGHTIPA